jgi:hypothetical protein
MNARMAAIILGVILIIVGLWGFAQNPVLGLFAVNGAHNIVHLVSGIFLLIGAFTNLGSALALKILGVIYVLVAIIGFFSGDMLLGFISNNTADNWLHVLLAIVLLGAGFGLEDERRMSMA